MMSMKKEKNINTVDYWDTRFGTGDWAEKGGFTQTRMFAEAQLPFLRIPSNFTGEICDFGCGAGDAFSVYQQAWPQARLLGVDFSAAAIQLCAKRYGQVANFECGDVSTVPKVDIIICSNVLEHLDNDLNVVEQLLKQCKTLYVIVPYKEQPLSSEHIRSYGYNSFSEFTVYRKVIFKSRGWTEFSLRSVAGIYMANIFRYLKKQPLRRRRLQILFEITANLPSES